MTSPKDPARLSVHRTPLQVVATGDICDLSASCRDDVAFGKARNLIVATWVAQLLMHIVFGLKTVDWVLHMRQESREAAKALGADMGFASSS